MRADGYLPIRDYALVGDGRTGALVGRDGCIDWLCLPQFDSPSVFARILDAERGGCFALAPEEPFEAERRYLPRSNVLETTFRTASGSVRVTDAMTLADRRWVTPLREVARRVEGLDGSVRLRWRVEPRFGYATRKAWSGRRRGRWVAGAGADAVTLAVWGGEVEAADAAASGTIELEGGGTALLSLAAANREPLVLPGREDVESRLRETERFWPGWVSTHVGYEGRWHDLVERSALVLKLLVFAPSGAIVAAPTTSLPEWIGGGRNWDYRFTWVRDAAYTLAALMRLGCTAEAQSFFWWLSHATAQTQPRLRVLYRVDGDTDTDERELGNLEGYRGSRPVRIGNGAAHQTQLDVYGAMLEALWLYADGTGDLETESGRIVARIADWVARHWRGPDAGIWEVRSGTHDFVQSKAMCWVALDRAAKLAERGLIPDRRDRWRAAADEIRAWVEEAGWDDDLRSYVRAPDLRELDASLLTLALFEYGDPGSPRIRATVDAVERELRHGPFVHRYRGRDGVGGPEGAFLTCSFWLAGALAKIGRVDDAVELMDELAGLANDVGLYAEEADADGAFLGNFPQALTHLALVNAAVAVSEAEAAA